MKRALEKICQQRKICVVQPSVEADARAAERKLDITTLHRNQNALPLAMNDLARVTLHTSAPLCYDSYRKNRQTGCLILVDAADNTTVAAGMIL